MVTRRVDDQSYRSGFHTGASLPPAWAMETRRRAAPVSPKHLAVATCGETTKGRPGTGQPPVVPHPSMTMPDHVASHPSETPGRTRRDFERDRSIVTSMAQKPRVETNSSPPPTRKPSSPVFTHTWASWLPPYGPLVTTLPGNAVSARVFGDRAGAGCVDRCVGIGQPSMCGYHPDGDADAGSRTWPESAAAGGFRDGVGGVEAEPELQDQRLLAVGMPRRMGLLPHRLGLVARVLGAAR